MDLQVLPLRLSLSLSLSLYLSSFLPITSERPGAISISATYREQ